MLSYSVWFEKPQVAPVAVRFWTPLVQLAVSPWRFWGKMSAPVPLLKFCGRLIRSHVNELDTWASKAARALSPPRNGSVSTIAGS